MKKIVSILLLLLFAGIAQAELDVHFIDVGQGDATLILCDGEAMLIDGGPASASQVIYSYLQRWTDHLDYMIATHPHEDHIGGLAAALNAVPVDVIYSPVAEWNGASFQAMKRYADEAGTPIIVPYEGDMFALGGSTATILHCWPEAWGENDMSICLRIDYGSTSFLFTGDAEEMSEYMMLDSGAPLSASVLKVAHHGSRYSSTHEFINAVNPTYAVISCGKDNSYGHPHEETLSRLDPAIVLRTDELGTIVMHSDGIRISIDQIIESVAETGYIGNRNSMKFHLPSCEAVAKTSPRNRVPLATREEAIDLGYEPCNICRP